MNSSIKKFFLFLGIACLGIVSFGQSYTIGTGTTTSYSTPYCNYYNYSVTQSLYTASEIGVGRPAKVSSIAFYVDNAYSIENQYVKIYLANTSKTSFTGTSDALASSAFTLVYSGYITIGTSAGWETITLNKNFGYDGTNLVIAVAKIGTYQEPLKYRVSATTTAKTIYSCSDGEDIQGDITSCTYRNTLDSRANVKITFAEPELSDGSYRITDKYDLYWFASKVKAGNTTYNGKVTKNIVVPFSEYNYARIGNTTYHYKGTFNGSSKSIGLEAESASTTSSVTYQGLFPYNEGTIQNLKYNLKNVTIKGSYYVGAICGYNAGTIQSCSVNNYSETTNTVTGTSYDVGGVCGYNAGTISSCSNAATIIGSSYNVGGICGYSSSTGVVGGSNSGAVKGTYNVGGVCGKNEGGKITSGTSATNILIEATSTNSYVGGICGYNTGKMIASSYTGSSSNVKGVNYVGGVVGYNGSDSVKNFHARNSSTVSATGNYVGGVCGSNSGKLVGPNSYAVVSSSGNYVGGIVGYNTGTVDNGAVQYSNVAGLQYVGGVAGYNTGTLNYVQVHPEGYSNPLPVITATTTGKAYVGGACGKNTGTIHWAYPSAVVSGTMFVGGIVGENSGKVSQSYPDYNYEGYSVTATTSSDTARCGGVCGVNLSAGTIDTCSYAGIVTGNRYVGGVCGDNTGTIRNGSASSILSTTSGFAGGVCGNNSGTLTGCSASLWNSAMTIGGARSGGVCGNNTGTITSCHVGTSTQYSSDTKYTYTFNNQYTGGVCGYNTGTIKSCQAGNCIIKSSNTYCGAICGYNTNSIVESNVLYTTVTANGSVGGVCGYNSGTISKSLARNGSVTLAGSYGYVGGIAGRNYGGTVSYCYSTISVTQTGSASNAYVGGLVGTNELSSSKIEYCYNQGNVTAKGNYCGGLAGYSAAQITNTYAYGTVRSAGYYVGGLIGYRYSGTITNSFYLGDAAADGNNKIQNGCGASSKGSTTADPSGVNKKSYFSFANGEVCYLLNGSVNGGSPWGQAIQSDVAPMLKNTSLVYKITDSNISVYSNSADYEIPSEIAEKLTNFEGDGSLENPFLIPDLQHLEDFRDIVKAGYKTACGKLTANIVMNESVLDENGDLRSDYRSAQLKTWIPIKNYRGCFDGDNHTIKGMFCMDASEGKSLFENITNGEIKNLTISDGYVKTSNLACGICQKATNSHIINCHNSCVIVTDGEFPMSGGICGNSVSSVIEKCSNTASVINTRTNSSVMWVGGIVGLFEQGSVVRECYNTGEVVGAYGCGGIAGMSQVGGGNLIERCYNTGLIRGNGYSSDYIGGILGLMDKNDIIQNCYNTGNIMGVRVGGIVSFVPSTSTVEYCYNAGTINGTRKGGIAAGKDDGSTVSRNYFDKTVCGDAGGVNGVELSNQAYGHTTSVMCNSTLSTALDSYFDASIWQAGTTSNASTEVITDDNVFGYKIIGTYPSLKEVGEPQYAKTLWVNIGTEESPQWISDFIPIYTIAQLKAISDNLDATYVLMNNVSEGANIKNGELVPSPTISWTPINRFTGKLYGLGHTISGLYTESSDEYVGLFSETEGAIINGVKIANSSFKSTHNNGQAGGIVGYSTYQYINGNIIGTKIIDCDNVSCTVEANYEAGGIVGIAFSGSVDYCRNYGTVISNYAGRTNSAGGICGASYATIRYCYNEGTVSGIGANVGGIGGGPSTVRNCYNVGTLSGGNVGGIAGSDGLGTEVYNSYSAGQLSASGSVGSVIGMVGFGASATESYYDEQVSPFDGISGSMDREGKVESRATDELCLELQSGLSSDDWAIKEPVIKDGKKYLYYPYLKHFGEESAKVATYRQICNVVLNQNGGTCTPLTQYIEREGAELPQDVVRDGYTFGGWYSNASCTSEEVSEIPVTATGEQTFYAKWTANDYSVTLDANGGKINVGDITNYTYGTYTMLPQDVTRTGHTFKGWYPVDACDIVLESCPASAQSQTILAICNLLGVTPPEASPLILNTPSLIMEQASINAAISFKEKVEKKNATVSFESLSLLEGTSVCDLVLESCGSNKINVIKIVRNYTGLGLLDAKNLVDAAPVTILTQVPLENAEAMKAEFDALGDVVSSFANSVGGVAITTIYPNDLGDKYFGAKWEANTYSVNLQVNGGTNTNTVNEYTYGIGATLPDDSEISREGYTFAGWYMNSNYDGMAIEEISTTDFGDKTYYAKWNVNSYDITLDTDGGTINSGNITSYTYGVGATLPTDITKTGYKFEGWYDDSSDEPVLSILSTETGDRSFSAQWTKVPYVITLNANEGMINGNDKINYNYGDEVTLPVPTREGYTFAGWYNNSNLVGTEFTKVASTETGNKEFWARWEVNTYFVTLNADGGEINSGNVASYTYNVLTILPQDVTKVGHTFEGWFDSENQKVTQISKGTIGDVTFTAKWTAKTYNVTLQTNNGTINGEPITSYTYGIGATLPTNITKTGYDFQGWYDNSSYDGGEVTEIASNEVGDRNFWAKWTAGIYDVTLDVDGGTVNSNAIERYTYGVGAVLPTDVTKIGFTFKGWKDEDDNFALEITTADYGDKTFTAQWEQANYGITYNANGGTINESYEATYNYGNEITLPTDVTKDGCEFLGWYDNSNFTGEAVEAISATEYGDKTFYAKWLANSYDVILVTNEGTINSGNIEGYTYGVTAILPSDVTKDGYTFTGWYSDEDCVGDVVSIISSTDTGNKTFYAGWSNTAYSVTLHTNDGIISSGNVTAYTFGTEVQLPTEEQISKTGYTFGGWYDNASCSGEAISFIASTAIGAKQYWAKWNVNTYNVTFVTNEGTIHSGNVKSYIYGTTVVLPSDVTKMGYTFDGWYDNESCSGSSILSISSTDLGDKTFYANWIVNSYVITLVTNDGTINSDNIENYTYGEEAILPTDVTKNGYTFDGWFTNTSYLGSSVSSILPTETGDKTFYAKWEKITYSVALNINGGTINSGAVTAYNYGNTVILPTDVSKTGSKFEGWYDNANFDGEAVQSITPTETGDKEFFAKWSEIEYSITLNVNGGAISGDYATSYKYGMAVELPTEVTKEGCTFEGWYTNSNGDGLAVSGIEPTDLGAKTFWAIWTVNSYKVSVAYDNAMGSVEGAGNYRYNRQATLTAKSDDGYEFIGWETESALNGVSLQDSTIQFIVTDNVALTANFKKKEIIYAVNKLMVDTLKTGVQNEPISLSGLFKASEDGSMTITASSSNPSIVVADVVDGKLYLTTNQFKGVAEVTLTAKLANGNKASLTTEVVVEYDCDITIADVAITNVSCHGLADGKIELTAAEGAEYSYQWINSESTANVIENIVAGNYQVVITDEHLCEITKTYTVSQPDEIIAEIAGFRKPKCGGTDGEITVSVAAEYNYLWSNGATSKDLTEVGIGDYTLKVTDPANGCFITLTQTLEYPENPTITVEAVEKTRCDQSAGAVIVSVDNQVSYNWASAGETISTEQNLTNVAAGLYTLTVTDGNNCSSAKTVEVKNFEVQVPQISLVTVSRQTGKNLIVWVRENTDLIDYYTIYREDSVSNEFNAVGTVKYSEISVFEDEDADPMKRQWSYRITATDICGNETAMSETHTTLHLNEMKSLREGQAELIWQPYVGVDYRSFYIVRETKVGSYTFIDTVTTVPASATAYTPEIPSVGKTIFYVGIKLNEVIDPKDFMKAESGPFALALSNIAEAENMDQDAVSDLENSVVAYAVGHTIYVKNADGKTIELYEASGRKINTAIGNEVTEFTVRLAGIYFVKVEGETFKVLVR